MYRKIGLIVCAWALAWVFGCGVYADNTTKVNTANVIEILKPEVGSEGDVVLKKDTLYVNLRLSGTSVVYMSLNRIDPEFYLGSQPKTDDQIVPSGDFEKFTEAQKMDYRRAILAKKDTLEASYDASNDDYYKVKVWINNEFGDVDKMEALKASGSMTSAQLALAERYQKSRADYIQKKKEYAAVKAQYDKVFARLIYGPVEVKPSDILRTYQAEIQGVKPGTYILAFSENADGTKIVKSLEFKGETAEKTVEKIRETLPESINKLFTGPAQ